MDSYSNKVVSSQSLPAFEQQPTEPVSARYRYIHLVVTLGMAVIAAGLLLILFYQPWIDVADSLRARLPLLSVAAATLGSVIATWRWFADKRIRYALREQDVILHQGLFFRQVTCQPLLRIQHIELTQNPLERLAGISRLQVYSAGGGSFTFEIPGLPEATAQAMRQFILSHKDFQVR